MLTNQEVIAFIEAEATRRGVQPSTFCKNAVNDGGVYKRLVGGDSVTLRTVQRIKAYAEKNP